MESRLESVPFHPPSSFAFLWCSAGSLLVGGHVLSEGHSAAVSLLSSHIALE